MAYFKKKIKKKEKYGFTKGGAVKMALIKWFGRGKAAEKRAKAFTASQRKLYPKLFWRVQKGGASKSWKVYANPPRKKR